MNKGICLCDGHVLLFLKKSKNILNYLIAFEKNGEVLDYGTLCIKTFRVHGFDIIFNYYVDFLLMKLLPGSPLKNQKLSPAQKEIILEKYGLNDPVLVQYARYLGNLAKGDLGYHSNMITVR